MERLLLKRMNAQKLEGSVQAARQIEFLVKDGHHEVNGHRDPDLGLHRIGAGTEVVFDTQVTFDPFEEEFDLPAALVELCHRDGRDLQIVGEEDQILGSLLVEVMDTAQRPGEVGGWFGESWPAYLIAENPLRRIPRQRTITGEAQVALGASYEEGACQNDPSQSCKIHVATIHHIEGTCLEEKPIEPENIGLAGSADMDAGRDRASKIELGVHLDPGFGGAKVGPREESQGVVDGRGIECVD